MIKIQQYTEKIDNKKRRVFFAISAGKVVGHAIATYEKLGNNIWVGGLFVKKSHRRKGAGKMLINAITAHAIKKGADSVSAAVDSKNTVALDIYKRNGSFICFTYYDSDNVVVTRRIEYNKPITSKVSSCDCRAYVCVCEESQVQSIRSCVGDKCTDYVDGLEMILGGVYVLTHKDGSTFIGAWTEGNSITPQHTIEPVWKTDIVKAQQVY